MGGGAGRAHMINHEFADRTRQGTFHLADTHHWKLPRDCAPARHRRLRPPAAREAAAARGLHAVVLAGAAARAGPSEHRDARQRLAQRRPKDADGRPLVRAGRCRGAGTLRHPHRGLGFSATRKIPKRRPPADVHVGRALLRRHAVLWGDAFTHVPESSRLGVHRCCCRQPCRDGSSGREDQTTRLRAMGAEPFASIFWRRWPSLSSSSTSASP